MTNDTNSAVRDLTEKLAAYADQLGELLRKFRPSEGTAARAFFATVPETGSPDSVWGWTGVLAGLAHWRAHRIERRLSVPSADELDRVAAACRTAAEPMDGDSWRWLPFSKPVRNPKDVLIAAANLLDTVRTPDPLVEPLLEALAPLERAVEESVRALPTTWAPVRLADLVTRLRAAVRSARHPVPLPPGPWDDSVTIPGGLHVGNEPAAWHPSWWSEWLGGAGAEWFHDLATLARTSREAGQLLNAICRSAGVTCFPLVCADSGAVTWPPETSILQPGLGLTPGSPHGSIGPVERFSTAAESARFTLNTGPDDATPLALAAVAWREAEGPELAGVRQSLAGAVDQIVRSGEPPAAATVLAVLDQLAQIDLTGPTTERVLAAVRMWAATGGWIVVPEGPPETSDNLVVKAVFKLGVPAQTVLRLKAFGLLGPDGVVRPGEVVISAGPPPHGLTDLEAAAANAPGEPGEELRSALRGLRAAGAGGYAELATVDLYALFWDRVLPDWATSDSVGANAFAAGLSAMLQETYGVSSFHPLNYRDHPPDWVTVPPGTRMSTGRVTRVTRPGLTTNGALRLPARVEAE